MKILITGATGLVGQEVGLELVRRGHELVVVSRSATKAKMDLPFPCEAVEGDLVQGPLTLPDVDAVVHLMGESVAEGKWTAAKKQKIYDSRILSTRNLRQSLQGQKLSAVVMASAVGYYGDREDEELDESKSAAETFLAKVCQDWEKELRLFATRTVALRIGIVLNEQGGALQKMIPLFQKGLGGNLGPGKQWTSWIHLEDLVRLFCWSLENQKVQGALNAVSPNPVTNKDFTSALAQGLGIRVGPPVPAWGLRAIFGEMSTILLASQKVLPKRALELGFEFQHKNLNFVFEKMLQDFRDQGGLFVQKQFLPKARNEVFPFFSDARNLEKITPSTLHFHIVRVHPEQMAEGTLIDYKLRIHGVPVRWQTRIEAWKPTVAFVDTQLKGPYQLWHHTHTFEDLAGGTLMQDRVRYKLPLGWLGNFTAGWFVAKDVAQIFSFRRRVVAQEFGIAKKV